LAAPRGEDAGTRTVSCNSYTLLSPRNIRVNVVAPGVTKTPIWNYESELAAKWAAMIPLGRLAEADEIAKAVLFLASDDSSYVQSVELFIDGGNVGSPNGGAIFRSA